MSLYIYMLINFAKIALLAFVFILPLNSCKIESKEVNSKIKVYKDANAMVKDRVNDLMSRMT
ncbi:MAG: hypothetical protein KAG37_05205, partial [Flavobacteriales bacterium]|nr:hypothetical protein [Flavobacteriales bacterium]